MENEGEIGPDQKPVRVGASKSRQLAKVEFDWARATNLVFGAGSGTGAVKGHYMDLINNSLQRLFYANRYLKLLIELKDSEELDQDERRDVGSDLESAYSTYAEIVSEPHHLVRYLKDHFSVPLGEEETRECSKLYEEKLIIGGYVPSSVRSKSAILAEIRDVLEDYTDAYETFPDLSDWISHEDMDCMQETPIEDMPGSYSQSLKRAFDAVLADYPVHIELSDQMSKAIRTQVDALRKSRGRYPTGGLHIVNPRISMSPIVRY